MNDRHDPKNGRFAPKSSGSAGGRRSTASLTPDLRRKPEPKWEVRDKTPYPDWKPGERDLSRIDRGHAPVETLVHLPGGSNEHLKLRGSGTGRMAPEKWAAFVADVKKNGVRNPVQIRKYRDGRVVVDEGNHRIAAALAAGLKSIPVEISYHGGSEREGLVYNPKTRSFDPRGRA